MSVWPSMSAESGLLDSCDASVDSAVYIGYVYTAGTIGVLGAGKLMIMLVSTKVPCVEG